MHRSFRGLSIASAFLLAAAMGSAAPANAPQGNVAPGIRLAKDLGAVDPSTQINITVHLQLPNKAAFDNAVDALYVPGSPTFHKWMTDDDLKNFAPTEAQRQVVRTNLQSHGLTILASDPSGFTIRARGTIADISSAFNTPIHQLQLNGKVFQANMRNARLSGEAGNYVSSVSGIENHAMRPQYVRSINMRTRKPYGRFAIAKNAGGGYLASLSTTNCLLAPTSLTLEYGNVLPIATYSGNLLNTQLPCAYTPQQLQNVYKLQNAYKNGYDGTGQTIVLVEAFGYPTMESDANAYFQLAGLPPLTSSNFSIVYPQGPPASPVAGVLLGWDAEIALDIEATHSIAPGAKIVVVAAAGQDDDDLENAIFYAAANNLGNSISNSYADDDGDLTYGPLGEISWDEVLEYAVAKGISVNFATGDSGDTGLGSPVGSASVPSNSPHATAVGGTTILNKVGSTTGETITTGWGDMFVALAAGSTVLDPPQPGGFLFGLSGGFVGGGGGGESIFFPKPSWQASLPGTGRQTPDVSALADPSTGFPIVMTYQGTPSIFYYGGTSLACPIFSGMWAIANQYAQHPLGQAARTVASLAGANSPYVVDVLPYSSASASNVTGTILDLNGLTSYSPADIFSGLLEGNTNFTSGLAPLDAGDALAVGFGLDTSLTVTPGWDNVTGYGTPDVNAMGGIPILP